MIRMEIYNLKRSLWPILKLPKRNHSQMLPLSALH